MNKCENSAKENKEKKQKCNQRYETGKKACKGDDKALEEYYHREIEP